MNKTMEYLQSPRLLIKRRGLPSQNEFLENFPKLVAVSGLGFVVFYLLLTVTELDLLHSIAAGFGGFLSTVIAFRWYWGHRYRWEQAFFSLRPVFQTILFVFIILGPLPPLVGFSQYLFNVGAKSYYWILYLGSPLAFLSYEVGYQLGLGRHAGRLFGTSIQQIPTYSFPLMFLTFGFISAIFIYGSYEFGFSRGGFADIALKETEVMKAAILLFDGFLAIIVVNATANINNKGLLQRITAIFILFFLLIILIIMQNRTRIMIMGLIALGTFQLIKGKRNIYLFALLLVPLLYSFQSMIREGIPDESLQSRVSLDRRLEMMREGVEQADGQEQILKQRIALDMGYRLDAFDEAGGVFRSHEELGTPYMWGQHFLQSAHHAVPALINPVEKVDPEGAICQHYNLVDFDQNTTLFGSAFADGGFLGVIIFFSLLGSCHAILWRLINNPRNQVLLFGFMGVLPSLLKFNTYVGGYFSINLRNLLLFMIYFYLFKKFYNFLKIE